MRNMQVVQKGVYTLNCFLSVKETPQLEQGGVQDVVVCITATTTITTTYLARVLCTADQTYMVR